MEQAIDRTGSDYALLGALARVFINTFDQVPHIRSFGILCHLGREGYFARPAAGSAIVITLGDKTGLLAFPASLVSDTETRAERAINSLKLCIGHLAPAIARSADFLNGRCGTLPIARGAPLFCAPSTHPPTFVALRAGNGLENVVDRDR